MKNPYKSRTEAQEALRRRELDEQEKRCEKEEALAKKREEAAKGLCLTLEGITFNTRTLSIVSVSLPRVAPLRRKVGSIKAGTEVILTGYVKESAGYSIEHELNEDELLLRDVDEDDIDWPFVIHGLMKKYGIEFRDPEEGRGG